ncbi:uncharacterized protein N0V89_010083 [Didymosphaeria variabile]|uniref:Uncharacterized protein n=1 Tax=Didymosphaeria variabile TaxID=1932322 RepID=A0A9W9C892_9PLEO|nr:uncharacterized protein N0V89_010083 [Didymosphaeria variabile]KAJ4348705.1 hypothetical protein N0V89_010083 [Didymosphaeria variabile]
MAQDRSQFPKDAQANRFTGSRPDLTLSSQHPGSFMKYTDERSLQLEQCWTTSQSGLADNKSVKAVEKIPDGKSEQQQIKTNIVQPPATSSNWNDIPDDMLRAPFRGRNPKNHKAMSKARNAGVQAWRAMYGGDEGFPDEELFDSMDHTADAQAPATPAKLTLHRVKKMKPAPYVQKFKLKNSEPPEGMVAGPECDRENMNNDEEKVVFPLHTNRPVAWWESSSKLDLSSDGSNVNLLGTENEHKTPKAHDIGPSVDKEPNLEDDFTEHDYLKAKAAAGEPTILPKDMLARLREQVKADEERHREQDPRYQHELVLAKVNAAQAEREANVPNEVLYPEKGAHGEKCYLDNEQWDLLEEFEVQDEPELEDEPEPMNTLRPENTMDASEVPDSEKKVESMSSGTSGRDGTMYGWASKAGNVFTSKLATKEPDSPKPNDRRKTGWTLADVLEEDEVMSSRRA